MFRFIDLRGQDIGNRFAFYNTVEDCFLMSEGEQAWSCMQEPKPEPPEEKE